MSAPVDVLAVVSGDEVILHAQVDCYCAEANAMESPRAIHLKVMRRNPAAATKSLLRREPWVLESSTYAITDGVDAFSGNQYAAGSLICSDDEGYPSRAKARAALARIQGGAA